MSRRYRNPTYVRDRECPFCHCFFTPQGLSGHLRFAHKSAEDENILAGQIQDIAKRQIDVQIYAKLSGLPEGQIKEAQQLLNDWRYLTITAALLRVKFTEKDFKEYIRARFMKSCGLTDK
jgi:hypothetical protein